jgi:hypothetical protein
MIAHQKRTGLLVVRSPVVYERELIGNADVAASFKGFASLRQAGEPYRINPQMRGFIG